MIKSIADFSECKTSGQLYYDLPKGYQLWCTGASKRECLYLCRYNNEQQLVSDSAESVIVTAANNAIKELKL